MFTVVRTLSRLSLDEHFIHRPEATFFAAVRGDGLSAEGVRDGDVLIVDRSLAPQPRSIVVAAVDGELVLRRRDAIAGGDAVVWGVARGLIRDFK